MSKSLSNSLIDGPVSRTLLTFSLPIFCANVLQSLNATLNAFWVGRYLGEVALSAVINAHSVIILINGASLGIASASTILVAQSIGAGNVLGAKRVFGTGVVFFLVLSIVLTVAGIGLTENILAAMKMTPAALPLAIRYLEVLFVGLPSMCMYGFVVSLLLGSGDSKAALKLMGVFVVVVSILDPLFIFGLGPLPAGGVAGSALALCVAQTIGLGALASYLYRRRHPLCLYKRDFALLRIDWSVVVILLRKGIPIGTQTLVLSLSHLLMIVFVNPFGDDTTAAYGASLQLWAYTQMPAVAISTAVSAMTAQNVGAKNWDRVNAVARAGIRSVLVLTGLFVLLAYVFEGFVYRMFLPGGSAALAVASHINSIVLWSLVLINLSAVQFGVIRGHGSVIASLVISGISLVVVRFAFTFALVNAWRADALWWSFPVSNAFAFILGWLYFRYGRWGQVSYPRGPEMRVPRRAAQNGGLSK